MRHEIPSDASVSFAWRIALFVGINWSALGSWLVSINWVATSTTVGVVIFNLALGGTSAWNHVRAQRLKWRREDEEANKESLRHQVEVRDRTIAEREKKIAELEAEIAGIETRVEAERAALHLHRNEINRDSLMRINEANDLRREVAEIKRELNDSRRAPPGPTINNPAQETP